MALLITNQTTRGNMLNALNADIGVGSRIDWVNGTNTVLATTNLNAAGNAFTLASGQLTCVIPVGGILSTPFSTSGVTNCVFKNASGVEIARGTVALTSGGEINVDGLPLSGMQLRLDSLIINQKFT